MNTRNRPYIIINCAMSLDGKIALPSKKPVKLSSMEDFKRVHELRNYCDGILVGINTIIFDDPKLTVKPEYVIRQKNPIRIVLDTRGRTPQNAKVLDDKAPTIIVIGNKYKKSAPIFKHAELVFCPTLNDGLLALDKLMVILKKKGIENLLVEGGENVIYNFIKEGLFDELNVFISSTIIGGSTSPTLAGGVGAKSEDDVIKLRFYSCERMGDGVLMKYLAK